MCQGQTRETAFTHTFTQTTHIPAWHSERGIQRNEVQVPLELASGLKQKAFQAKGIEKARGALSLDNFKPSENAVGDQAEAGQNQHPNKGFDPSQV